MCTVVRVSGTKSDATLRASSRATRRFAERFSFFSFKARPIDFSDRNVQFPDRRLRRVERSTDVFSLGGRDLCFPVARDQHAPTPRAVAHNRGARESESYGDAGRSGSVAMTFVATALGPRVRPAAVAAGPRGSAHGGTVGAIATAANRQRCLRRRAPGATIARLDARHTLGVGAGAVRRARGDATSRGARACRLQVNAHGSHGTSLAPSETTSTRVPDRHRCLISRNPRVCLHVDF